jgi:hypothetical protein
MLHGIVVECDVENDSSKSGIDDTFSYGPNDQERYNMERNEESTCSPVSYENRNTEVRYFRMLKLLLLCLEESED